MTIDEERIKEAAGSPREPRGESWFEVLVGETRRQIVDVEDVMGRFNSAF